MHQPLQSIIQHLFQVNSLDDVSRQRLESFVEEYPSFGIGHYLLSHKLQTEDTDRYQEATQRTGLYFSNPLWLQWLLENGAARNGQPQEVVSPVDVPAHEATLPAEEPQAIEERVSKIPAETTEECVPDTPAQTTEEPVMETPEVTIDEPAMTLPEESTMLLPKESTTPLPEETIEEPVMETRGNTIEEPIGSETASAAEQLLQSIEEAKGLRESLQKINEDFSAEPVQQDQPIHDEETPYVLDEPEESSEPAPPQVAEHLGPIPAPAPPTPTPDLVFEPYHTIDYFASQGIKLKLDENPGDALGKQLKSFTDWLRIMRRLPQKDREASVPDRVAEQAVQHFAAHSIQSKDVVTETMAEVLIKQGMRDRARAIYEKLSLLNPDKKAYFAAKIEQLNIP